MSEPGSKYQKTERLRGLAEVQHEAPSPSLY